jgi:hypothetical protein
MPIDAWLHRLSEGKSSTTGTSGGAQGGVPATAGDKARGTASDAPAFWVVLGEWSNRKHREENRSLRLTPSSVRSCLAPAGSSG